METMSLFVPVTELQALRCLRDCVEELVDLLDGDERPTHDELDAVLSGVRSNLAELRAIDEGEQP